ncbi:BofC C-terminal domain-containing protein [Thermoanaerobacterium sp. DL9XJH110]|uniref:BofC C-terminal domain-containing protein n=1 Tax=Thermoanaerobacterium sp. DL9XJH110 TaxID=3386643 RepID=UPI003BB4F2C7
MPKKLFRYIIFILVFAVLSFGYGYFKTFVSLREPSPDINQNRGEEEEANFTPETKLKTGAKFVFVIFYSKCGHEIKSEETAPEKYEGFTRAQLEQEMAGWEIRSFTSEEVILRKQVDDICNEHYYIGLKDGYVALFQGIPGVASKVIEKTDILADTLREEDRNLLEKGLIITGREEFLKIREGLTN